MDAFKEALEREKSRVLALEAVQVSMQTAHRDIVSRMQENFDQEMEGVRNKVDSAHGEQVQELQSLLEERHKMVGREIRKTQKHNACFAGYFSRVMARVFSMFQT